MSSLDLPARPRYVSFANRSFSAEEIGELLARPAIVGLTFTDCRIGDAQVRALCALPKLERLWLEGSDITDLVLPAIAALPRLEWLNLDRTHIDGSGLAAFAGHTSLSTLSARHTRLGDSALPYLLAMASLSHLGLEGARLSDEGIMALAALPTVHLGCADSRFKALQEAFIIEQRRLADRTPSGFAVNEADSRAIEAALEAFFVAMSEWESRLALRQADDSLASDWNQQECIAIFERFCSARDRKYGRPNVLSFQTPPEYSQQRMLRIEWLSAAKACVYTLAPLCRQDRFIMLRKAGAWRIDHRQSLLSGWENVSL